MLQNWTLTSLKLIRSALFVWTCRYGFLLILKSNRGFMPAIGISKTILVLNEICFWIKIWQLFPNSKNFENIAKVVKFRQISSHCPIWISGASWLCRESRFSRPRPCSRSSGREKHRDDNWKLVDVPSSLADSFQVVETDERKKISSGLENSRTTRAHLPSKNSKLQVTLYLLNLFCLLYCAHKRLLYLFM